jgi:hypothetical protein
MPAVDRNPACGVAAVAGDLQGQGLDVGPREVLRESRCARIVASVDRAEEMPRV